MQPTARHALAAAVALAISGPALAQFSPNPITTTVTTPQALPNTSGTVATGGAISLPSSNGSPALTMTGTSTLTNNGTIQTAGSGRAIDSNAVSNLTVTNTGLISSVSADGFRVNTPGSSVSVTNSGTIQVTNGGQAIDWANITTGANSLTNQVGGSITARGEDAVRPGQNGVVINAGTIAATTIQDPAEVAGVVTGSDGIDLRTQKTVTVTNTGTITGRHGIATDGANTGPSLLTLHNDAGVIQAQNGSGVNIDGVSTSAQANITNAAGATIKGGALAIASASDGDGIDVDGVLTLDNAGDVLALGAKGAGSDGLNNNAEAVAIGGGTITNRATGKIIGSTLLTDAPNGDAGRTGSGILVDNSSGGNAIAATTITNDGLIEGKSGFGVKIVGNFADTITNNAGGAIHGAAGGAAVQTGGGADTLINRGAITGDTGVAVDLEAGDDVLRVEGGAASITGNVSGGAGINSMAVAAGAGNAFAYSGSISNFSTVDVQSGHATFSGVSTYTGQTIVSGGVLTLDGANRIAAASGLTLAGGALQLANAGGANGQTFASLSLTLSSTIDLALSSLSFSDLGTIVAGKTLGLTNWDITTSPSYAFRFFGDKSASANFLALVGATTINGFNAYYTFDGTYTNVLPTPLPGSFALLLSALGFMGAAARRRSRPASSAATA